MKKNSIVIFVLTFVLAFVLGFAFTGKSEANPCNNSVACVHCDHKKQQDCCKDCKGCKDCCSHKGKQKAVDCADCSCDCCKESKDCCDKKKELKPVGTVKTEDNNEDKNCPYHNNK